MLNEVRQSIIDSLWATYRERSAHIEFISAKLRERGVQQQTLDHFAVIDLPGPNTGIPHLNELFSAIGFTPRGNDYLPEKQNDFQWMCVANCQHDLAERVLPQVVVADFRLEELPSDIRTIIETYSQLAAPSPLAQIQALAQQTASGDHAAAAQLAQIILHYLNGRDWPLPTVAEFKRVHAFNELLAWVLVFGRRPNHFTLSVHLMRHFANLADFHRFIEQDLQIPLNQDGGVIKGCCQSGIEQSSTAGYLQTVQLQDGNVQLPGDFVEFVWRYPRDPSITQPTRWGDYFTDFVATHANRVIESLYTG